MINYILKAHLKHLQLAGQEEDGELMWWKAPKETWDKVYKEIEDYEIEL